MMMADDTCRLRTDIASHMKTEDMLNMRLATIYFNDRHYWHKHE
jgi:hypothetical protein